MSQLKVVDVKREVEEAWGGVEVTSTPSSNCLRDNSHNASFRRKLEVLYRGALRVRFPTAEEVLVEAERVVRGPRMEVDPKIVKRAVVGDQDVENAMPSGKRG